jgi:phospholipase/carboxylesterase
METIEIQTGERPEASVIWLHGLGADGHDFEPIVPELRLSRAARFIFPHAPVRPVTINNGMRISQEKKRGIAAKKILLAGFSQGGAIVLQTGLRHPERLAGIMALSTYLPLQEKISEAVAANRDIPIFMAHGTYDDIIPLRRAEQSKDLLLKSGYAVEWHAYPMPHSVCPEEIGHISQFLAKTL